MEVFLKPSDLFDLSKTIAASIFDGLEYPWQALPLMGRFILALGETLPEDAYERRDGGIWIARSAKIYPSAHLSGPLIVDCEAEVRHCAFIRGSAVVGKGAVVGNSTELKNCLLFDRVQVPHYNYVGDSILGYRAHMGAGSITSNVRSDKAPVRVHAPGGDIPTGLKKFGAMLGDMTEVGCNAVLNPGVVLGRGSWVYPGSLVRGVVPAMSIYKDGGRIAQRRTEGE
jgi:NDP-sugar pyrophosphorylase family protein